MPVCRDKCRVWPALLAGRLFFLTPQKLLDIYWSIYLISPGGGCFGCVGKCCKIYFIPQIFLGKHSFMIRLAYFSVLTCNNIISLEQKKTCFIVSHNLQKFSVTKTVAGNSLGSLADMGSCLN